MARHLHHHHHHAGFPANIPEIPILVESHPAQLKHIIDSQTSQSRSLFVRTPPGVGGGSSSSDSSESDSGGFDSESSGSSDSTDKSDDSGFDSDNSSSNEHKTAKGGVPISIPVALGVMYGPPTSTRISLTRIQYPNTSSRHYLCLSPPKTRPKIASRRC